MTGYDNDLACGIFPPYRLQDLHAVDAGKHHVKQNKIIIKIVVQTLYDFLSGFKHINGISFIFNMKRHEGPDCRVIIDYQYGCVLSQNVSSVKRVGLQAFFDLVSDRLFDFQLCVDTVFCPDKEITRKNPGISISLRGEMIQSKSEVIIADKLSALKVGYM